MTKTNSLKLEDFLQIPLAIGSFVFFKMIKILMKGFIALAGGSGRGKPPRWRIVSSELIGKTLALPIVMTRAPRWNPHAIIATIGPLEVKSNLSVNVTEANNSAEIWSISIQPMGKGREERLSSASNDDAMWGAIQLPAGRYTLALRYYNILPEATLPTVQVDGRDYINAVAIDPDNNQFYASLAQRSSWLYAWLSYYVYTMLRFAGWLPDSFVTREFLPSGDTGMKYSFGAMRRRTALRVSIPSDVLVDYAVYFTSYDRASFPIESQQINTTEHIVSGYEVDGFYLIRYVLRKGRTGSSTGEVIIDACVSDSNLGSVPE